MKICAVVRLIALAAGLGVSPSILASGSIPAGARNARAPAPLFSSRAALTFSDQTSVAGLNAVHAVDVDVPGAPMMSGGAIGDFDNDGWQDLFVLGGGLGPDRLFINNQDGTFSDRAAEWGINVSHVGVGAAVADYDGDGWLDIYVTSLGADRDNIGPGHHKLYQNNGTGHFTDQASVAGVDTTSADTADGWSASFGDYDVDGDLDLVVAGWFWGVADGNQLFRNEGDGTFTRVTDAALAHDMSLVRGFTPRFTDMNGDRYPELLFAADFHTSLYFANDTDGTFTELSQASGTGLETNGMGSATGDFDRDGRIDWYVTSIHGGYFLEASGNMLYRNQGGHVFQEQSKRANVNDGGWGWGTQAVDFDHDGWLDIAETNGWLCDADAEYVNERSYLFRNLGSGAFEDVSAAARFDHVGEGRALLRFDYDNDGDQDVVIFTNQGPLKLLRNDLSGASAHWLKIFFDTRSAPGLAPRGCGTRVTAFSGAESQSRYLDCGSSYLGTSEPSVHFGLASAGVVDTLRIEWADGAITLLNHILADQTLVLTPY